MKNIKDRTLAEGEYKGYNYRVLHNGMGYRCGYVKVSETHPVYGRHYDDVPIVCHGGLTYNAAEEDGYWIGFDCAHLDDGQDPSLPQQVYMFSGRDAVIRTTEYCIDECKKIIDQLTALV